MSFRRACLAAALAAAGAAPALAQSHAQPSAAAPPGVAGEPVKLGEFQHWAAYAAGPTSDRVCYAAPLPQHVRSPVARDGRPLVFVTHRPAAGAVDVVAVAAAYDFRAETPATVDVGPGRERATLFTLGAAAFAPRPEIDDRLVKAMRIWNELRLRGTAEDGREIEDSVSLMGFTAAYFRMSQECGVRPPVWPPAAPRRRNPDEE